MKLARDLAIALAFALAFQALTLAPTPGRGGKVVPERSTVPCTTDDDCARKNPGAVGLYAFPEKAGQP